MVFENEGYCPVCRHRTVFVATDIWLSENYVCRRCNTLPRHRALVTVLDHLIPKWRKLSIHESSPSNAMFSLHCRKYSCSQYLEGVPPGDVHAGVRCENLERMTFKDSSFDIFVTQAVLEHVFNPDKAVKEIMRVLRDGGVHVFSAPKHKHLPRSYRRALLEEGNVKYLCEPMYHGNPIGDGKSLVTWDYGSNFDDLLMMWSGYQTSCYVVRDRTLGIDGEYLEIFVTRKADSCRAPDYLAQYLSDLGLSDQDPPRGRSVTLDPGEFVRSLYNTILRREPDDEGFAWHVGRLNGGMDPTAMVREFSDCPEARALRQRTAGEAVP